MFTLVKVRVLKGLESRFLSRQPCIPSGPGHQGVIPAGEFGFLDWQT
jgi:hypothetical protein